jgi:hypothetical protein
MAFSIFSVYFLSADMGWIAGYGGAVYRTINGGQTWDPLSTGTINALRDIVFTDENHGWAVGVGGTVIATRDGGASWSLVYTGTKKDLNSVYAKGGRIWAAGNGGAILKLKENYTLPVEQPGAGGDKIGLTIRNGFRESRIYITGYELFGPGRRFRSLYVDVLDCRGRVMRQLPVTSSELVWDNKDSYGRPVAGGVYLLRLQGRTLPGVIHPPVERLFVP